jgi:carboxypeptidase C (cathepsin A)
MDLNDEAFKYWNWGHFDPTGEQRGGSIDNLYTSGDLAASMALNPYLKVFSANGYYDAVTPFFRTILALENMPLEADSPARNNLTIKNYPSGHMIYLDPASRSAMKADLVQFYESTHSRRIEEAHVRDSRGARRVNRIPY